MLRDYLFFFFISPSIKRLSASLLGSSFHPRLILTTQKLTPLPTPLRRRFTMGLPSFSKGRARSSWTKAIIIGSLVMITLTMSITYNQADSWALSLSDYPSAPADVDGNPVAAHSRANDAARDLFLNSIYNPRISVDSHSYIPHGAFGWNLSSDPIWTKPLGENLCIIDLDNRPLNESGLVFGSEPMSWDEPRKVGGQSLGVLNHWLYAKIHGYKYYYVGTVEPEDRRSSWLKAPIIANLLRNHDACIYLDSDAVFSHLDLPFEWLMNYWQIDPKRDLVALANDPGGKGNWDLSNKTNHNTGFIIAQNSPKTYEIMKDWWECPNPNGKYPGCDFFNFRAKPGRPSDQGGWGSYVRYNYPDDIKTLECTDANGFPESKSGCEGKFISHFWTGKHTWIKLKIGSQLPGAALELFHQQFLEEKETFYYDQDDLFQGKAYDFTPGEPKVANQTEAQS